MDNLSFTQLDEAVIKAFAALGINSTQDLLNQPIEQIWADFEKLTAYLPEHKSALSFRQLEEIYYSASSQTSSTEHAPLHTPRYTAKGQSIAQESGSPSLPTFIPAYGSPRQRKEEGSIQTKEDSDSSTSSYKSSKLVGKQNKSNAQRCRKSFRTYMMALLTVFMTPLFLLSIVGVVASIFTGYHIPEIVQGAIIYAIVYGIFILFRLKTRCQICRISTFSLKDYPHNKHAHDWLFFGYNYSTAFHIVFCFWFRCPACGTAVQVFKPKRKS